MSTQRRALFSVSDKRGIVELGRALRRLGFEILSTGGTARALAGGDVPVVDVSAYTAFPEILDGRVKTLHPRIHAGILARPTREHLAEVERHGIGLIELVVVNLYPFRETVARPGATFEDAIEQIDVGGPTMVRAAAKNWERVGVVVEPADMAPDPSAAKQSALSGTIYAGMRELFQGSGVTEPTYPILMWKLSLKVSPLGSGLEARLNELRVLKAAEVMAR